MQVEQNPLTTISEFEVHLEPDRLSPRLFLMQRGARVSSATGLVSKPLRDLIQSQKISSNFEKELCDFLDAHGEGLTVHVHAEYGVLPMTWQAQAVGSAKTELDLAQGRVRVQRLVADKSSPDTPVRRFVRIGERIVGDLEKNRLFLLADASGWYAADHLKEAPAAAEPPGANTLTYEWEPEAEIPVLPPEKAALRPFREAWPFEVTPARLNDRKVGYPTDQRAGYLKDLLLKNAGVPVEAKEAEFSFRVTMTPSPVRPGDGVTPDAARRTMTLKAGCFWDGRWFDLSAVFFRYFEHLHAMRSMKLRKKPVKRRLAESALRLLTENSETRAEKIIELEVAQLGIEDEPSRWEATEYLRRFFKTFVLHKIENLLVKSDGWYLVNADPAPFGALFLEVQKIFGGDLLDWLGRQEKEVPVDDLFSSLRLLHARLEVSHVQLCYRDRPVRKASFRVRVKAFRESGVEWFEIHPRIGWESRTLSESEWRTIVANRGAIEDGQALWLLEEPSLKTLEMLRELLDGPRPAKQQEEEPARAPRLHVLDWVQLRRMGAEVELSAEDERLVRRLLRFEKMEPKPLPQRFKGRLRDYQKEGYDWLAFLYEHGLGGCLADDMGLGKTVQAIAFLGGLREKKIEPRPGAAGPHLVIVPSTLVFNWKREFENFYPDIDVREYERGMRALPEVLLTTYDIMRREHKFFQKQRFHAVVFDEAQYMKNLAAKRTASARRLQCAFALTLTGTPLENHLGEYYSILDLSLPGLLGDYEEFRRRSLADPLDRLKKRAAPFVLRRTKDNTLKELPPKTESEVYLRMSPKQKTLYRTVISQVKRDIRAAFDKNPAPQASMSALTAILRLRQVCVSPRLVDRTSNERSPKIEFMISKLRELVDEDHSALVFSQFTSFLDVLEEEIRAEKLDYQRMDGSTSKNRRKTLVDAFQCGAGAPIFLISLKTGGVGLNLTRASYVFHLDPWWNPAVENQASDRVHRIGQKKNVFVTRLLMQHSIEEKMMGLKKKKSDLYRQVLEGITPKSGKTGLLSKEDFEFLLGE